MSKFTHFGMTTAVIAITVFCAIMESLTAQTERQEAPPSDVESAYRRTARDSVDAAGPFDEQAVRRLQQAEDYLRAGRPNRALETLTYALDQAEGGLVRRKDGRLVPIADEVHRLLTKLPPATLEDWRRRYAEVANDLLQEGIATGRLELVEQAAREFRMTEAGRDALWRLALVHADRGQFALAARYLKDLQPGELPSAARIRAVRILTAVDHLEEAKRWRKAIPPDGLKSLPEAPNDFDITTLRQSLPPGRSPAGLEEDWRVPFGSAVGFELGVPGRPLLLSRWTRPLTSDIKLQHGISRYNEEVQERMHAVLPAAIPLVCDNHVFVRLLDRVCAFDLESGRLAWESTAKTTPLSAAEREAALEIPGLPRRQVMLGNLFLGRPRGNGDRNAIANFLYRDSVEGLISADSERVYLIQSLDDSNDRRQANMRLGFNRFRSRSNGPGANELHAFDMETGRPAWRTFGGVGGRLDLGAFGRPLSGYFFFGPPTPIEGELYVIGEKDSKIELIALDPHSGMKRWSRKIATAPLPISQEPIRRNWSAPVAAAQGILICPTTVGWLVAVDRTNHSLLWAYRYAPVEPAATNNPAGNRLVPVALDRRWAPAAPIIHEGRVYFTPPEELRLVCLDLVTGRPIWKKGKGNHCYVAGVADEHLIVVGAVTVEGLDPATMDLQWSFQIPPELGSPTGRGVLSRGQFIFPTTQAVLTIDTANGKLIETRLLAEGQRPLGNLVMRNGVLASLGAEGLVVYEERGQYLATIKAAQATSPDSALARFLRARLLFGEGDLGAAAAILGEIDIPQGDGAASYSPESLRNLRWNVLRRLVQSNPAAGGGSLEILEKLAQSEAEKRLVQRLRAVSLAARGKPAESARLQMALLSGRNDTIIEADGPVHRRVRQNEWIAGKLLDLWQSASEAERAQVQTVVNQTLADCEDPDRRKTMVRAVSGLPFADEHVLALARQAGENGMAAEAELTLLRLLDTTKPNARGQIYESLAELAARHRLDADARYWRNEQRKIQGKDDSQEAIRDPDSHGGTNARGRYNWNELRVISLGGGNRSFSRSMIKHELTPRGSELPSYRNFRFWINVQNERLFRYDERLGEAGLSSVPLRGRRDGSGFSPAWAVGHVLILAFDGAVQAVSLLDGRVIWSWDIESPGPFRLNQDNQRPMRTSPSFRVGQSLARQSQRTGSIVVANAHYVLLQDDGRLTALDTLTGRERWSRDHFGERASVVGTSSSLFVRGAPGKPREARFFRAIDGSPIPLATAGQHTQRTIDAIGDCLLTLGWGESDTLIGRSNPSQPTFSLYDPLMDRRIWTRSFPVNALFDRDPGGTIYVLSPDDGALSSLDPESGRVREIGQVPTDVLNHRNEVFLLTDSDSVYVIVNQGHSGLRFLGSDLPAITVNGDMFVFDRRAGGLRWQREIDNQRLMLKSFPHMSLILFMAGEQRRVNNQTAWQTHLFAIDKSSNKIVLEEEVYARNNARFHDMAFRPRHGEIEIVSFSGRIRISAARRTVPVVAPRAGSP